MVGTRTLGSRNLGFADVLARWGSTRAIASDLGIPDATVRSWISRDSVPQRYWSLLEQSAKRLSVSGVTYELLRKIDARIHPPRSASASSPSAEKPREHIAHFATDAKAGGIRDSVGKRNSIQRKANAA